MLFIIIIKTLIARYRNIIYNTHMFVHVLLTDYFNRLKNGINNNKMTP